MNPPTEPVSNPAGGPLTDKSAEGPHWPPNEAVDKKVDEAAGGAKPKFDALHRKLDAAETKAAYADLVRVYPVVVRSDQDPAVVNQTHACVSFILFDEPKLSEIGKVYGFCKVRGAFGSQELCQIKAAELVRKVDSKNKIRIFQVGAWTPITDCDGPVAITSVSDRTEEESMIEPKVLQQERKLAMDQMDIRKRAEAVVAEAKDQTDEDEGVKAFCTKMQTFMSLTDLLEQQQKRIVEVRSKLESVEADLRKKGKSHPEFRTQWLAVYNEARVSVNIPRYVPSKADQAKFDSFFPEGGPRPEKGPPEEKQAGRGPARRLPSGGAQPAPKKAAPKRAKAAPKKE